MLGRRKTASFIFLLPTDRGTLPLQIKSVEKHQKLVKECQKCKHKPVVSYVEKKECKEVPKKKCHQTYREKCHKKPVSAPREGLACLFFMAQRRPTFFLTSLLLLASHKKKKIPETRKPCLDDASS